MEHSLTHTAAGNRVVAGESSNGVLSARGRRMLSKVPEVTFYFWVIKVLCTTVGETAADYLNENLGFGLTNTTIVTGVLLIALLVVQFRARRYVPGIYWAVVVGVPPKTEGAIDLPLAKRPGARDRETMQVDHEEGQKALTHFRVMDHAANRAALLALWPRTGRTHQLRVHCAEIGCPILGDRKYGGEEALLAPVADAKRLHLHARRLALPHPSGRGELRVEADPPPHFRRTVEAFGFSMAGA